MVSCNKSSQSFWLQQVFSYQKSYFKVMLAVYTPEIASFLAISFFHHISNPHDERKGSLSSPNKYGE